ncbi:Predicted PurR-regulated permease PerM [Lachnospiraceae bacterium NE2001]|nr:Predicted PurR-regulated permease PerM [Lachnospiraceae bacterium NE2001]
MNDEEKKKKRLDLVDVRMMFTLAGAGCIVVLFFLFIGKFASVIEVIQKLFSAMTPIIIGFVIAFLLNPLVNHLRWAIKRDFKRMFKKADEKRLTSVADALAVTLSVLFLLLIITALLWILIPQLYESVQNLYNNFDQYVTNVENMVNKLIKDYPDLEGMVNNYMDDLEETIKKILTDKLLPNMNNIVVAISNGVVGGLKMILNFVIGIIAAIYILASKDKFSAQAKKIIYSIFDKEKGNKILSTIDYVDGVFSGFIGGKLLDSFIIGAICFIFCTIVNMPYAMLISVIIGVTNIIPFFGPFIGAIPSALLVLVESPKMCVVFIIFIIVLQQVDGNIIGPLILADSTGLSSFWVLFAILVGGNLFGFFGMVLGVPTFACIYALLTHQLRNNLNKRGLKNDTEYFVALRGFDENGNPVRGPKKKFESASNKRKRERQMRQLQQSKQFIDKVTRHEKKGDTENLKSEVKTEDINKDNKDS